MIDQDVREHRRRTALDLTVTHQGCIYLQQYDMLQKYINKLSKSELQEALIQVLYDGPEWQFERFINEHIKW